MPIHRVLIIEGDLALRRKLTSALTEAGYTVVDVADILRGNEIRELSPDLAIVDEVLPSGDGKGFCSLLHHHNIPIILLGKDASGEAWVRATEAGVDFYFTKPVDHQETVARVKAILQRYQSSSGREGDSTRAEKPSHSLNKAQLKEVMNM